MQSAVPQAQNSKIKPIIKNQVLRRKDSCPYDFLKFRDL